MFLQASLSAIALSGASLVGGALVHPRATAGDYVQTAGPGNASFTMYSGCAQPACGIAASGFTAAISQLAFGSVPGLGPGDACGRCFSLTGSSDPFSPHTRPIRQLDICEDTGGSAVFFPSGHGALLGSWSEVSCSLWSGSDGSSLFNGACISGEKAPLWPSTGCGNQGP
ncbi:endoglucanase V-like protein [Mycena leptocephala]|nr:endoglucanase V-like protein [Mycena leptocephala]